MTTEYIQVKGTNSSGRPVDVSVGVADASLQVELSEPIAGERNTGSTTGVDYVVTRGEHIAAVVSAGTGSKTISASPCHLGGIYIHTALAGTFTITGLLDESGTAASVVIPASTAAGFINFLDARCESSLSVQKSSATDDGRIVVFWRLI